jgi:hypothetical protein
MVLVNRLGCKRGLCEDGCVVASECWCTAACTRGVAIYRRVVLLFWSVVSQAISQTGRLHIATTFPVALPWGHVLPSVPSLALRGIDWIARLVCRSVRRLDSRYASATLTSSLALAQCWTCVQICCTACICTNLTPKRDFGAYGHSL